MVNAVFDGGLFHGIGQNPKKTPAYQDDDLKIQLKRRFDAPMHTASKQFSDLNVPASEGMKKMNALYNDSPDLASATVGKFMRMDPTYCNRAQIDPQHDDTPAGMRVPKPF